MNKQLHQIQNSVPTRREERSVCKPQSGYTSDEQRSGSAVLSRAAIFISGAGSNMQALVKSMQASQKLHNLCECVLVFSNKENALGLQFAAEQKIPTVCISSQAKSREVFEAELLTVLKEFNVDIILLAGFMRILSPFFIQQYVGRILNIHPADTKLYQGAHGYEWAFETKQQQTFITVHLVDEGVDTGTVLSCTAVDLRGATSLAEVKQRGLIIEHQVYAETLKDFLRSHSCTHEVHASLENEVAGRHEERCVHNAEGSTQTTNNAAAASFSRDDLCVG